VVFTGGVSNTLDFTGLSFPIHDVYLYTINGDGSSDIVALTDELLVPPTGKNFQTVAYPGFAVTAVTNANPASVTTSTPHGLSTDQPITIFDVSGMTELEDGENQSLVPDDGLLYYLITVVDDDEFTLQGIDSSAWGTFSGTAALAIGHSAFENAVPRVANGDIAIFDREPTPDPDAAADSVTLAPDGLVAVDTDGSTIEVTWVLDVYDASNEDYYGEVTNYINPNFPELIDIPFPPVTWYKGIAIDEIVVTSFVQDTHSFTTELFNGPPGVTAAANAINGTPSSPDEYTVEITVTNDIGSVSVFDMSATVIDTASMPDVDDGDVALADGLFAIVNVGLQSPDISFEFSEVVTDGFILSQIPAAGTIHPVDAATSIVVATSSEFMLPVILHHRMRNNE
jgi:hypothetical protein